MENLSRELKRKLVRAFLLLCISPQVQMLASQIGVVYNLLASIPSLVVAPLWGPWTDKGDKRKPALLVAIIGACLEMATVLLIMYFNWSVYFLYVSAAISGFSGFATVLLVGAMSYIADISTKEERAFRIGENISYDRSVMKDIFIPHYGRHCFLLRWLVRWITN